MGILQKSQNTQIKKMNNQKSHKFQTNNGEKVQKIPSFKNGDDYLHSLKENALYSSDILGSEIQFRILIILSLFPDLTLKEIYTRLKSPKTTVYRHLNKLIENETVESFPERVNGNQNRYENHYRLKGEGYGKLKKIVLSELSNLKMDEQKQIVEKFCDSIEVQANFVSYAMNLYHKWFSVLNSIYEPNSEGIIKFNERHFIKRDYSFFDELLTEDQYTEYKKVFEEFSAKVDEIVRKKSDTTAPQPEKPYYIFHGLLPIKDLLGYDEIE